MSENVDHGSSRTDDRPLNAGDNSVTENPPEGVHQMSSESMKRFPLSLVVTDPHKPDNPIVYCNKAFYRTTGYRPSEAVGRNCRFLQGEDTDEHAVARIRQAIGEASELTIDLVNYRADGERFINRLIITPLRDANEDVQYFLGVQTEVGTEGSEVARRLEVDERLREVQHRVKNHLAMVLSMIRVEARKSSGTDRFDILESRVRTLTMLYDHFSEPTDDVTDDTVPLGAYVTRVVSALQVLSDRHQVRINVDTGNIRVRTDTAARVGLALSEIVTNALRHAFDDDQEGELRVELVRQTDGAVERVRLCVADDGHGLDGKQWPDRKSLGGRIVIDLIERLDADLDVETSKNGTTVTVMFKTGSNV